MIPASGEPPVLAPQSQPSQGDKGAEGNVRAMGRHFVSTLYGAIRSIRLYPVENEVVQKVLAELTAVADELLASEGELEVRVSGEFIFVNATRLRLDLDNYATFSYLLAQFRGSGVGVLRLHGKPATRDWTVLLSFLLAPQGDGPSGRYAALLARLASASITVFEVTPPVESEDDGKARTHSKERAKRTYAQSVAATKDVMNSVRLRQNPNLRKIKRVVQGIVDQILSDETSLVGLTTIRDYDDYTFTHSVNVCIFAVALGRRLGLSRLQLYDIGVVALFHDVGKSRVPIEVLNKSDLLSDEEWRLIAAHPWQGVLSLFQLKEQQEYPYRAMIVAFQHHMKRDLTGYPRSTRTSGVGFYSKIVAIADAFDAATSRRAYRTVPLDPAAVLAEMRDDARRGLDPVIVKAFVILLGIYPVGTFVVLDTFELAIIHSANPEPEMVSRPKALIVSDNLGNVQYPGILVDLSECDEMGEFRRTIIKTADPERFGIRIGDYFI
ncbi:MAG TPA: HD domain-containing phosphohydrolase [Gemmatimonadaceae bacterium]|nr:HD domain-containing phosphohydrolase [Gemmatimonadaceae bacterium]